MDRVRNGAAATAAGKVVVWTGIAKTRLRSRIRWGLASIVRRDGSTTRQRSRSSFQKVDEQVTEVPRTSSRDRTLQCTEEQILDVLVPETAKQLMEVPETVSQDRIKQRTVEQIVDAPVSETVEELADVFKVSSQDRIQQYAVEQTIEIPAVSLDEKIIEVPVARTPEKAQQVVNTLVQHDVNTVEVERPQIMKQTWQKPIIQEKINQVTRHVEIPQVQFLNKVDEMPVGVQRQILPMTQTVQKTTEIPQLQFPDQVHPGGLVKPDDPDAQIKFLAAETLTFTMWEAISIFIQLSAID